MEITLPVLAAAILPIRNESLRPPVLRHPQRSVVNHGIPAGEAIASYSIDFQVAWHYHVVLNFLRRSRSGKSKQMIPSPLLTLSPGVNQIQDQIKSRSKSRSAQLHG